MQSPVTLEPCITARVLGLRSARDRIVGALVGVMQLAPKVSSASEAAASTSFEVSGGALTELGEEITAEERFGCLVEQHASFPAVGHVWRVDVSHSMPADFEDLAIGERDGRAVGEIVE